MPDVVQYCGVCDWAWLTAASAQTDEASCRGCGDTSFLQLPSRISGFDVKMFDDIEQAIRDAQLSRTEASELAICLYDTVKSGDSIEDIVSKALVGLPGLAARERALCTPSGSGVGILMSCLLVRAVSYEPPPSSGRYRVPSSD